MVRRARTVGVKICQPMHVLHFHPQNAPRHKLRGKRRYFERVQHDAEAFVMSPKPQDWWDVWHYHADWPGWGNLGWRHRRPHLLALCKVFQRIGDARAQFSTPFQAWMLIDGDDAGQDATYLHTPNPNGTEFPIVLAGVEWGTSALQPMMESLLPGFELEVGWGRFANTVDEPEPAWRTAHYVYARGVGVPLRVD